MDAIVIHCTVPDKRVAKDIAKCLLKYKMAACVSAVDRVDSLFSWDGEIEKEKEVLLMIKTLRCNFDKINPVLTQNKDVQYIDKLIFNSLVNVSKDFKIESDLAQEISKINDKTYIIKIKENKIKTNNGKRVISRLTVQQRKKNGDSYQKIEQHFGVDKELIRKIDLGFYGQGYTSE